MGGGNTLIIVTMKSVKLLRAVGFVVLAWLGAHSVALAAEFDENPTPLKTPPPAYPTDLKDQKVGGMVLLKVSISESGAVEECEVKKSTHSGFDQSALQAVKGWKFNPAKKDGAPVKAKILLPVKFNNEG